MAERAYVIGDTHLGAGVGDALEDFDQDDALEEFAVGIARPDTTLFLNGDFIDFPQIAPFDVPEPSHLLWTESASLSKLETAIRGHAPAFAGLKTFLQKGGRLAVLVGNHDLDLAWPKAQERLRQELGAPPPEALRFTLGPEVFHGVLVEHGHELAPENCPRDPRAFFHESEGERYLERVWGTDFMLQFFNELEGDFPFADNVKPMLTVLWHGLKNGWVGGRELLRLLVFLKRRGIPWKALASATLAAEGELTPEDAAQLVTASFAEDDWQAVVAQRVRDQGFRDELAAAAGELGALERDLLRHPEQVSTGVAPAAVRAEGERTMGIFRDDRERRGARQRLSRPGVTAVVFGHTHEIVDGGLLQGDLKGQLFNPGTWLPSLDLSLAYVREKIREDGLSLDMLKDPTLYTKARRAVRIDANPGERASVSVVTC